MLLSAYVCLAVIGAVAADLGGAPKVDLIIGRAMCIVSGLAALETLATLVFEGYRVRIQGRETRLLYESRLVGLEGQPEANITTAANALDYQFGFKVSETWFYRFFEKAIGWLILAQLVVLLLSTCFVVIDPGDEALLEVFGSAALEFCSPDSILKAPWPIGKTIVYHTQRVQTFLVGPPRLERLDTIAWTVSHAKEENFLVASKELNSETQTVPAPAPVTAAVGAKSPPVSLLSVSIPVHYQITNLTYWAYTNEDPVTLPTNVAERQVVQYLASADFDDLMSRGRSDASEALRQNIQNQVDNMQLGARITFCRFAGHSLRSPAWPGDF